MARARRSPSRGRDESAFGTRCVRDRQAPRWFVARLRCGLGPGIFRGVYLAAKGICVMRHGKSMTNRAVGIRPAKGRIGNREQGCARRAVGTCMMCSAIAISVRVLPSGPAPRILRLELVPLRRHQTATLEHESGQSAGQLAITHAVVCIAVGAVDAVSSAKADLTEHNIHYAQSSIRQCGAFAGSLITRYR